MARTRSAFAVAALVLALAGIGYAREDGLVALPSSSNYARADWAVNNGGNYGRPEVIKALQLVGQVWSAKHPDGPELQYNDISLRHGGPFVVASHRRHLGHQRGVEVDVVTNGP